MVAAATDDETKLRTRLRHMSEKWMKIVVLSGKLSGLKSVVMKNFVGVVFVASRKRSLSQKPRKS